MDTKKVILWPVIISIVGHITLITVSSMIDLREDIRAEEIITVNIKDPEPEIQPKTEEEEKNPSQSKEKKDVIVNDGWREDTVDLNSPNPKYFSFLLDMRRRLNGMWTKLDHMKKLGTGVGVVTLIVSVNADGSINNIDIISSSGPKILEQNAKLIVNSVAGFSQLTDGLSRLHVTVRIPFSEQ